MDEAHYLGEVPHAPAPHGSRRRKAVRAFFRAGGFPTARDEDWRHSDLGELAKTAYARLPRERGAAPAASGVFPEWTEELEQRVRLADGVFRAERPTRRESGLDYGVLALIPGQIPDQDESDDGSLIAPRAHANGAPVDVDAPRRHPFEVLNAGLFDCGFRVRVRSGHEAAPVLLYSKRGETGAPAMLHPRSVIELAPGSRATVIEAHDGTSTSPGWTNPSTLCRIGENAALRYVRLDLETGSLIHTGRVTFEVGRNARVHSTVVSLGGGRSRTDTAALLIGEGGEASLDGLFLGTGGARADQHTLAIHAARHTTSRQEFRNVLADEAAAVFDGKVVVAPGAAGTDAGQSNRNLLLSDAARVHTRPRLEIHNDDVRCAHGAAIGRLDQAALFYLRSRGLGRMDAREMLVGAFAGEVISRIPSPPVRRLAEAGLQRIRGSRSWTA